MQNEMVDDENGECMVAWLTIKGWEFFCVAPAQEGLGQRFDLISTIGPT